MADAPKGLKKPMNLSADLEAIVGKGPMPRTEVVRLLWVYIREHNLQDATNKRNVNSDDKLKKIFAGKETVNMFEIAKLISAHLSSPEATTAKAA